MTDLFTWAETQHDDSAGCPATTQQRTPVDVTDQLPTPTPPNAPPSEAPVSDAQNQTEAEALPAAINAEPPGLWQLPASGTIPENFADAIEVLAASGRFSPSTIRCWTAEVAQGARIMRLKPATLPTRPAALIPLLERVLSDRRGGLSAKRWSNIRSALKAIAVAARAHAPRDVTRARLDGAWVDLISSVPLVPQRTTMAGFARFCQASGISPAMASEADLQAYAAWRRTTTYPTDLLTTIRGIRSLWNRCRARIPGWPGMRFVAAGCAARRRIAPELHNLYPALRADLEAYLAELASPTDPFSRRGRALAPDTIRLHREHLLRATAMRAEQLGGLIYIKAIADIANPIAMKEILVAMHARAGNAWTPSAPLTASVLVTAARHHLGLDDDALKPMLDLQSRVGGRRVSGLSDKVRARLAAFDDRRLRRDLLTLPRIICERAEAMRRARPKHAAALHRRGIALHLLFLAALRRRNLACVSIAEDLVRDEKGRLLGLRIDGSKTKNGISVEAAFDSWFARVLQRHLAVHRQLLPGADTDWLFPSPTSGNCMSREGLANALAKEVRTELGVRFNVHLTRHLVATLLFEQDPGNSVVAQRVLGHTEVKSTDRMYGDRRTRGAQGVWAAVVDKEVRRTRKRRGGG